MRRYIRLSYTISEVSPLYPGTPSVTIEGAKRIAKGDSCNTFLISFSSHTGTHVDAPKHFWERGSPIGDFDIADLSFQCPLIINCCKSAGELIDVDEITSVDYTSGPDIILLRTGFQALRTISDAQSLYRYTHENPCLTPAAAHWIRDNLPTVRAIGIDCISIASAAHREPGREVHKILLDDRGARENSFFIVEDMYLPESVTMINEIIVSPLFIEGIDSAPCTVIGVIND